MSSNIYVITINLILLMIRFTNSYNRAGGGVMLSELKYLSELPLDKLLKVRKSLQEISCLVDENYNRKIVSELHNSSYYASDRLLNYDFGHFGYQNHTNEELGIESREDLTEAAALIGTTDPKITKKSYGVEEKPSKIQTIFQLSITALAFFAFGGYLLCMIVQAIKSKGTTYFHPSLMPMSTAGTVGAIKKRRPVYGRKRRKREIESKIATPAPDDLYNALRKLAENYVQQQQI